MPYIAQYLLKLSISLSVVYLFYALVLRRLTFYTWNRWYLLGYSLLAFFIPFVNISQMVEKGAWTEYTVVQWIPVMGQPATAATAGPVNGWMVALSLLLVGVVIMLARLFIQYLSFLRIRRSARLLSKDVVKIYQVNKQIIPFSFGRSIFINHHQHNEAELREIIRHEFIHVKQRHTADILWGEVLCMLNWYNPFAWLIRHSIRQNLEFIADHQVLKAGLDRKQYQYLLLKVVGVPAFAIANQFNFSSLKKRIMMMNKIRSARMHLIKFLFVLPLITVLLLAFRNAAIQEGTAEPVMGAAIHQVIVEAAAAPLPVKISSPDTIPVKGKITGVRIDSIRAANFIALRDSGRFFLDASLNGPSNPNLRIGRPSNPLVFIDGVEIPKGQANLQQLDPHDIECISVLKDKTAISLYGEKAMEGVLLITTKKNRSVAPLPPAPPRVVKDTVPASPGLQIRINNEDASDLPRFQGVIILDGVVLDSLDIRDINSRIRPDNIERIEVLKGSAAEELYGPKAKEGVIKITSKKKDNRITGELAPHRRLTYTAAEKAALQEQARGNNILFIGVENQVPITIKDVPASELNVTISQCHVTMKGHIAFVKPVSPGMAEMTIARKKSFNSPAEVLEKRTYTLKFLPPSGSFAASRPMITRAPVQVTGKPFVPGARQEINEPE